jgi:helicase
MKNGCKEELLNLIQLRGIGRVRARSLYKAGFATINRLRGVDVREISKVPNIGKKMAENIKEQLDIGKWE